MVIDRLGGTFVSQVGGEHDEEAGRNRDQPLVAALAVGDEHTPVTDVNVADDRSPSTSHRRSAAWTINDTIA